MALTCQRLCLSLRPPCCFPWLSGREKNFFPLLHVLSFNLVQVQNYFFFKISSVFIYGSLHPDRHSIFTLTFLSSNTKFPIYSILALTLVFKQINSKNINIFYLFLQDSTVTWDYSIFLFAFKAQIIYSSDFIKNKIFHAF